MSGRPPGAGFLLAGLTGGIASGKSAVAGMFRELGVPVVDADRIVHALLGSDGAAVAPILESFGTETALPDGGVDRSKLGRIVFADSDARRRLEEIVHPLVEAESERQVAGAADAYRPAHGLVRSVERQQRAIVAEIDDLKTRIGRMRDPSVAERKARLEARVAELTDSQSRKP